MSASVYEQTTLELMEFISHSPSPWHVAANLEALLLGHGFTRLSENELWNIEPGGDYVVTREGASLIAFRIPDQPAGSFQIVASHGDSPSFRIKENPELARGNAYVSLNVEKYGGMLCAPWFDRPLSAAGRAIVRSGDMLETQLVSLDRDLCLIPSLAIHQNRSANDGMKYSIQTDMCPLIGGASSAGGLRRLIAQELETAQEDLLSLDLFLYNRQKGCIWGADREFFSSPKLDDLMCAYSAVRALMDGTSDHSISVCAVFDHEEIGSRSSRGADSTFLEDTLSRISECLGKSPQAHRAALSSSFMISADNAHALHPNHPETSDSANVPHMNGGPVIKMHAGMKYTTDALTASIFREICRRSGIPVQVFANHSDQPGGSTLGNLSASHVSIPTVDIGMAQLAMHSPYETAGVKDTACLIDALTAFYRTHIIRRENAFILD